MAQRNVRPYPPRFLLRDPRQNTLRYGSVAGSYKYKSQLVARSDKSVVELRSVFEFCSRCSRTRYASRGVAGPAVGLPRACRLPVPERQRTSKIGGLGL